MNVETGVREELGKFPQSLTLIYMKIYEQMSDASRASRVILERSLKWLLCMQKRLSTAEFVAAVSINHDGTVGKVSKELILTSTAILWYWAQSSTPSDLHISRSSNSLKVKRNTL